MAGASNKVIRGLVDSLLKLSELADVGKAVFWLGWVQLVAQIVEHFEAIVEVDGLIQKLAHCGLRGVLEHGGSNLLALGLGARKGSGPVGDL